MTVDFPFARELRVGLIDQENEEAPCIECNLQSTYYVLDSHDAMWFACTVHLADTSRKLLLGEMAGRAPSLPPSDDEDEPFYLWSSWVSPQQRYPG